MLPAYDILNKLFQIVRHGDMDLCLVTNC